MKRPQRSDTMETMNQNIFHTAVVFACGLLTIPCDGFAVADDASPKPNIIYILADDLGYGELGCYGQRKIKTPHIDKLAAEGMRFTQHYAGSPVCAPSRCTLLSGYHTGHAYIRANKEMGGWGEDEPEGQLPIPEGVVTVAELLKKQGYKTAAVGKWGLGGPESTGEPNKQGFDLFYGYLCQRVAHNYYPTHLWRNGEKDVLEGNEYFSAHISLKHPLLDAEDYDYFKGKVYAPDKMTEAALSFIRENKDGPFFLYVPTPVPHAALQVPDDSLKQYAGGFQEEIYLGQKGYLPHRFPRAAYAAMATRMDRDVGRIVDLVKELGLDENTLIMFSSDNGPTFNGGTDSEFFNSTAGLRGLKTEVYEGGIRVPLIARWPGRIKAGVETDHVSAFWDVLPTLLEVAGAKDKIPLGIDGISFAPTLLGEGTQREHAVLYWEYQRQQALRMGRWKLVRQTNAAGRARSELFDLNYDRKESRNVIGANPDILKKMLTLAVREHTASKEFPSEYDARLRTGEKPEPVE